MCMKKLICFLILILPFLLHSQTRIRLSGFSEYDAWTHLDPFYIYEPGQGIDDFRPVEYEERVTKIKLTLDAPLMQYWIGVVGAKINFTKGWGNRKHIRDADQYLEYNYSSISSAIKLSYQNDIYKINDYKAEITLNLMLIEVLFLFLTNCFHL